MKLFFLCLILSSTAHAHPKNVVYGEDNRVDVFASPQHDYQMLAKSTAAMIPNIRLQKKEETFLLRGPTLSERGICSTERFAHQTTASRCSGFLVGENKIVTAGHCIRNDADCKINRWVFDFQVSSPDQSEVSVPQSSVYHCKKIISRELTQDLDYAVIEVDRVVKDRSPLKVRTQGELEVGESLVIIGYPSGLPAKIADGGLVRSLQELFFVASLDSFGGNSGSAVFNARTLEVEGLLVRGETDYIDDAEKGCKVVKTCPSDQCRGEDVVSIKSVKGLDAQ